jgi:indole-3-glycerol phosphate synthase
MTRFRANLGTEHLPNSKDIRTIPETQGKSRWSPPRGTLGELVASAERRAEALLSRRSSLAKWAASIDEPPHLEPALRRADVALIAEIKRASPSRGAIRLELDPQEQARAYENGGAAAVSILTEPQRFNGSNGDIEAASAVINIPILRKDFHVAAVQLYEARSLGASAALIIARALSPGRFKLLVKSAKQIGLEVLAEVRDRRELDLALTAGCTIIGVNNRNLETLEIEEGTAEAVIPHIPAECVAVAESGYSDITSVRSVALVGADAVLIGSFLSASSDPALAVRSLTGVKRVDRA